MTDIPLAVTARYEGFLRKKTSKSENVPDPGYTYPHLRWMLEQIRTRKVTGDKSHRWLGFIQGVLTREGHFTVQGERDFTRPHFEETVRTTFAVHRVQEGDTPWTLGERYYDLPDPGWRMITAANHLPTDPDEPIIRDEVVIPSGTYNGIVLEVREDA